MITVLTSGRGRESGLLAARRGMRRVPAEWPAAAKVCVNIWRCGLREISDMQVTSVSDRSPFPFMFRNNRGKVPSPVVSEGLLYGCSHVALHKTNIVQEDFQELERNMELFGCSLQTDMRDLSSGGSVRLNLFMHKRSDALCFGKQSASQLVN